MSNWNAKQEKHIGLGLLAASIVFVLPAQSHADTTNTPAPETQAVETIAAAKTNAKRLYDSGRQLLKAGKPAPALIEFEASNRAYPSWLALSGMGTCFTKLKRHDEALDALEALLRNHEDKLPEGTKTEAQANIDLLRKETGAFMVTSAAPGAWILIDGRWRGEHPLAAPVATLPGRHWVRVYKEGFSVYEKEIDISKGGMQTLDVTLVALPNAGRIQVGESGGKKMEVVVDGVPVGITPWEGPVSPGPHTVYLRPVTIKDAPPAESCDKDEKPAIPEDAGDPTSHEMGTEPEVVNVKAGQTSSMKLTAERLGAVVRIVPDPPDAAVYIDGVYMGHGPYMGRAKPGRHVVKTKADGYEEKTIDVIATTGDESAPSVVLKKDVNHARWAVAGRALFEVRGTVPLIPSLGGVVDDSCATTSGCQGSLGTGINAVFRGGYEWPQGLGVGATIGYFQLDQTHVGFDANMDIGGKSVNGRANDTTHIQNVMFGAYGSYRLGNRFPVRLGLGAGVMYGHVDYSREGVFDGNAIGPLRQTGYFSWIYLEPEARVGVRLSEHWSLGVSISGLVVIAPKVPAWTNAMQVNAHSDKTDQLGSFKAENITNGAFVGLNQGLYLQYGY